MNIVLADDHGLFLESMRLWLEQHNAHFQVSTVRNYADLRELLGNGAMELDLIITDLLMPGMNGTQGLARLCALAHGIPVLVVSGLDEADSIQACRHAGAAGFVPKSAEAEHILKAIERLLAGRQFFPSNTPAHMETLSPRQCSILQALSQGLSNREIAQELALSEGTVKQYLNEIYSKLGVNNRTQASLRARRILGME